MINGMSTFTSTPQSTSTFKDRKLGLLLFGILSIILGAMSFCVTLLMPISLLMQRLVPAGQRQEIDPRSLFLGIGVYLTLSGLFIWMGIGSIRKRRWCRPIMLIVAWTWLICGAFGLFFLLFMLPDTMAIIRAQTNDKLPAGFLWITLVSMLGVSLVMYVLLPLAYVCFYQSRHVKATLEHYQPQPDWSDRRPTMVLGLALGVGLGGLVAPVNIIYGAFPCFGVLLTGWLAATIYLLLGTVLLALAWLLWQQKAAGWWGLVILSILGGASASITWFIQPFTAMYQHMGLPAQQVEMLQQYWVLNSSFLPWSICIMSLIWLGFLIAVRRHFQNQAARTF